LSRRLEVQIAAASGEDEVKERELAKAALTYSEIGMSKQGVAWIQFDA
jgi:hypothetical protein